MAGQIAQTIERAGKPEDAAKASTKVAVVIPTMNEPAIAKVIGDVRESLKGHDYEVIVVDKSTDDTPKKARKAGARVVGQEDTGYGNAYVTGFRSMSPDAEIAVMIDGDDTYDPHDIPLLLEPILNGQADMVLGNRFSHMDDGAMTARNQFGNKVITWTINMIFRMKLKDSQTGLRALRTSALRGLELVSSGMPFASEMIIDGRNKSLTIVEVPVSYRQRIGQPKIKAYRDGSLIIGLIIRMAQKHNPLSIFLPVGGLMMFGGLTLWILVFHEWLTTGIVTRMASVAGGTLLFLAGMQIIIFGLLAGILVTMRMKK
jgi:glycosyltransferase involved in cell wall biosynthesis